MAITIIVAVKLHYCDCCVAVEQLLEERRGNGTCSLRRKGGYTHTDWDRKLDALVVKSCQKAGLKL